VMDGWSHDGAARTIVPVLRGSRSVCSFVNLSFVIAVTCACGTPNGSDGSVDGASDASTSRRVWPCPAHWVEYGMGGCGPAALLCGEDGGALPGACAAAQVTPPPAASDAGAPFGIAADAAVRGRWREAGDLGGPPDPTFQPLAGLCPPGWMQSSSGACLPMRASSCPTGSFALTGGRCTSTGAMSCPATEFPPVPPEAAGSLNFFVRAGADPATADGSMSHPDTTIAAALARATSDVWVVVAAGRYDGSIRVTSGSHPNAHVLGACAALVTIVGSAGTGAIDASQPGTRLDVRGVTVESDSHGVFAHDGATVTLRSVRVARATGHGVRAEGAGSRIDVTDSVVSGTRYLDANSSGWGVVALSGGTVTLASAHLGSNHSVEAGAFGSMSALVIEDSLVIGDPTIEARYSASGFVAAAGGAIDVRRVLVEGVRGFGILATDRRSQVMLEDVAVANVVPDATRGYGRGVNIQAGAVASLRRVSVERANQAGVFIDGSGARADVDGLLARETQPRNGSEGFGMNVQRGAAVIVRHARFEANTDRAVVCTGAATTVQVSDVVVLGTRRRMDGLGGEGISAELGAHVDVTRALLADLHEVGFAAINGGTLLRIEDSIVRDVDSRANGDLGAGISAVMAASIEARRVIVERATFAGVYAASPDTSLLLEDSVVRETRSRPDGQTGFGLAVTESASLTARRVLIDRAREFGVAAVSPGSAMTLEDAIVLRTEPTIRGYGGGVLVLGGASMRMDRVAIEGCAGAAISSLSLDHPTQGRLAGSTLVVREAFVRGVRSQQVRWDLARLAPEGTAVAYGLHVGRDASLDAEGLVVDRGGYGFFVTDGTFVLRRAVITGQLDAAGGVRSAEQTRPASDDVSYYGNALDSVVVRTELPEGSTLPPPTPVCVGPACM